MYRFKPREATEEKNSLNSRALHPDVYCHGLHNTAVVELIEIGYPCIVNRIRFLIAIIFVMSA